MADFNSRRATDSGSRDVVPASQTPLPALSGMDDTGNALADGSAGFVTTTPGLRWFEMLGVLMTLAVGWMTVPIATSNRDEELRSQFRTPYDEMEDYWAYGRLAKHTAAEHGVLMIGDSVVWGEYVAERETLTARLNEDTSVAARFVNGGVNGLHPLALAGLLQHYADLAAGDRIVIHLDLLWLTSPQRDLQNREARSFNHPRLIPQFQSAIVGYDTDVEQRLSIAIEQRVPFRQWVRHVRHHWFDGQDVAHWAIANPYAWPRAKEVAVVAASKQRSFESWQSRGIPAQDFAWVELGTSLQWKAMRSLLEWCRSERLRVFVIVGPLNTHLMTSGSRDRWASTRDGVGAWLKEAGVPHWMPPPLDSALYADASHPLAAGYVVLARGLARDAAFGDWLRQ